MNDFSESVDALLEIVDGGDQISMSDQEIRKMTRRRLVRLGEERVNALLRHAAELNKLERMVVRDVTRRCMVGLGGNSYSSEELERDLHYAVVGARTAAAYVHEDLYAIAMLDIRLRCENLGFRDSSQLMEDDSEHALVLRGMIIEDAIVNYAFEKPMYYRYLGENAEALLPHAQILTGDAPAGHHRVYLPRIESLLGGGSATLLEGVL